MSANSFGVAVRTLREERDWSLKDLADRSGVTSGQLSKIENGETLNPGISIVVQICNGFKVTPNRLLSLAGLVASDEEDPVGISVAVDSSLERLALIRSEMERLQATLEGTRASTKAPGSNVVQFPRAARVGVCIRVDRLETLREQLRRAA